MKAEALGVIGGLCMTVLGIVLPYCMYLSQFKGAISTGVFAGLMSSMLLCVDLLCPLT